MPLRPLLTTLALAACLGVTDPALAQSKAPAATWDERDVALPIVGHGMAYVPRGPARRVVLFISGDGGWTAGVVDMARRIASRAIVIGISYPALRKAAGSSEKCWYPAADLERISHVAEKRLGLPAYEPPILVGYSSGATLVYGSLAAAPPVTFAGGLSLGFCPDLPSGRPVCSAGTWRPTFDAPKHTAWLPKVEELPKEWYVLHGVQDKVCQPPATRAFLEGMGRAHFIEIDGTGHGFGKPQHWSAPFDQAIADLSAAADRRPARKPVVSGLDLEGRLDRLNLPLEYEWSDHPTAYVVFISGDGGWASLDQGVASVLAARKIGVVGVSSLRYLWNEKPPSQVAADLHGVIAMLRESGRPVFLGGYSFGAEVAPVAARELPPSQRRNIDGLVLVSPSPSASFEIDPLDWIRKPGETSLRVAPAVRALEIPTLCAAGEDEEEDNSACAELQGDPKVEVRRLPGSHHFNGDYEALGEAVASFIERVSARRSSMPGAAR